MTMSDDLKRLSDLAHSGEELLENLRHSRDNAEIDTLMECVLRWREELIALGEAIDPIRLRFRIMRPTLEQTARIQSSYPELRGDQRGHCNYVEAALGDLNAYLRQPVARPKRPGRKKGVKLFDDSKEIAEAHQLLAEPNPPSMYKAAWAVVGPTPKGASRNADARRIYNALRGV